MQNTVEIETLEINKTAPLTKISAGGKRPNINVKKM